MVAHPHHLSDNSAETLLPLGIKPSLSRSGKISPAVLI